MCRMCLILFFVMVSMSGLFACKASVEEEKEVVIHEGAVEEEVANKEELEELVEEEVIEQPPEEEVVEQPPKADFKSNVVKGQAPTSVTFTNNSVNADECLLDFGDGTVITILKGGSVTHEYVKAKTYTVTLKATKKGDTLLTDKATLTISIDHGFLAYVKLNTEAVRLGLGQNLTLTAEATDTYNNPIPEAQITWEAVGGAGTVDAGGVFTASMQPGEYPEGIVATANLDDSTVSAAAAVTVTLFPDINLETVIREALGKSLGQVITVDEVFNLRQYLDASGRGIIDLTGLERCTNLSGIDLSKNKITYVTPLSNLKYLMCLYLSENQIRDILPLANFSFLPPYKRPWYNSKGVLMGYYTVQADPTRPILDLSWNQISDVSPLAHVANLTRLSLEGNQISDISSLVSISGLAQLNIADNPLNDEALNTIIPHFEERNVEVIF
jgi:PKD repeat protein